MIFVSVGSDFHLGFVSEPSVVEAEMSFHTLK